VIAVWMLLVLEIEDKKRPSFKKKLILLVRCVAKV